MADIQIEQLARHHERSGFRCGKPSLDEFIHSLVQQYEKRKLGRTFVAVAPGDPKILGYYTLASSSVSWQHLPAGTAKKLPKHSIPVALIGRLAIDQSAQGLGLGETLLFDALHRCLRLGEQLGIFAVEVMAIDEGARKFYERYGFVALLDHDLHLFLPMKSIQQGMKRGSA